MTNAETLAAHEELLHQQRVRLTRVQLKQAREAIERASTILSGVQGMLESLQEEWAE